ncbi:MAG: flagellar biosynthetic protein FliO [Archangiaceae bacterium]|nr:flagellar biosynthetic protein FliO [Archangiaceae bacterium]
MTWLLLASLLSAEPAPPAAAAAANGEPAKVEKIDPAPAAAPAVIPPIPPADVPEDLTRADESLGFTLFRTLVVLGLVVMLAWVSLNWGLRKLLGIKAPVLGGGVVSVVERVSLDQRRSLFVVKAAGEYLLVGGTDASLGLISKLDAAEVEKLRAAVPPPLTLSPFLQKLLTRKGTK